MVLLSLNFLILEMRLQRNKEKTDTNLLVAQSVYYLRRKIAKPHKKCAEILAVEMTTMTVAAGIIAMATEITEEEDDVTEAIREEGIVGAEVAAAVDLWTEEGIIRH